MSATVGKAARTRDEGLAGVLRRGDLPVVALAGLLLLGAWSLRGQALSRSARYVGHGVAFDHAGHWVVIEGPAAGTMPPASAQLFDAMATATFQPKIIVNDEHLHDEHLPDIKARAAHLAETVVLNMRRDTTLFHLEAQRSLRIGGKPALRIDYSYALNPAAVAGEPAPDSDVPVVIRAATVVIMDGRRVRRVTVLQSAAQRKDDPTMAGRVLSSLALAPTRGR